MPRHVLRGIGPPFPKQRTLIDHLFTPDPGKTKQVNLCCGRGYGKSIIAIDIACRALSRGPGEVGLFLEPDWKRVNRVFLRKWRRIVPPELYTLNKGEQCITWINGAMLYYGPRNITGAEATTDDSQLGQDATFVIDDEAALRCSPTMYQNNLGMLREPSDARFYLTVSTPRVGPYEYLVTSPGHTLFRGKSADNPYLPADYVDNLRRNMSAQQAQRELDGEFVALQGRIWSEADMEHAWPKGNRHDIHADFKPNEPWWLFCDIGSATGAYTVFQQTTAEYRGRELFRDPVWVAIADLCPHRDASAKRAFRRLKAEYGYPAGIVAGRDIHTRSGGSGKTIAYFAQKVFGNVHIYPCDESAASKQIQYDVLSFMIKSGMHEERRFTIAKNFVSLDTESRRGIREMLQQDTWPEESKRRLSDLLPKGKENRVQHVRDAVMMGAAKIMSPPVWAYDDEEAA